MSICQTGVLEVWTGRCKRGGRCAPVHGGVCDRGLWLSPQNNCHQCTSSPWLVSAPWASQDLAATKISQTACHLKRKVQFVTYILNYKSIFYKGSFCILDIQSSLEILNSIGVLPHTQKNWLTMAASIMVEGNCTLIGGNPRNNFSLTHSTSSIPRLFQNQLLKPPDLSGYSSLAQADFQFSPCSIFSAVFIYLCMLPQAWQVCCEQPPPRGFWQPLLVQVIRGILGLASSVYGTVYNPDFLPGALLGTAGWSDHQVATT